MKSLRLVSRVVPTCITLLCVLCATSFRLSAQSSGSISPEVEEEFERLLEEFGLAEESDPALLDLLEHYRDHPIRLYTTIVDELARLPGISPQTARRILEFIEAESPETFDRFNELDELEPALLSRLRLYTTLAREGVTGVKRFALDVRSRLVRDLKSRRGYEEPLLRRLLGDDPVAGDSTGVDTVVLGTRYLGGPEGIMTRLLLRYGSFSGGILFEKDPGEGLYYTDTLGFSYENLELVDPTQPVAPEIRSGLGAFVSAHMRAEFRQGALLLGDYTAEFGQGLLFGESFSGRKGSTPTRDPHRSGGGLRSYRSSGEANYMRGIGVEFHSGGWLPSWLSGSFFLSRRSLDANIETVLSPDGDTIQTIRSIGVDGYLRTHSDVRQDDRLTEMLGGIHLQSSFDRFSLGLTVYHGNHSLPVARSTGRPPLDRWSLGSLDLSYDFRTGRGFGELALTDRGAVAGIGGIALQLRRAEITLAGRYYAPDFSSPHGVAFGESPADPHNECGLYLGVRTRLFPRAFLSFYGDLYRIPESRETFPFALSGIDGMSLFNYGITPDLELSVRLRIERRGDVAVTHDELGRDVERAIDQTIGGGRFDVAWKPRHATVEIRFRLEQKIARYSDLLPDAKGFLSYVDCRWKPSTKLSFGSRLVLFKTESSDVQLYEFEQDVPGRLTSIPLSGEGGRCYLLARWEVTEALSLSTRYSQTWYVDRETISAGTLQQIDGRSADQIVAQVDWGL